MLNLGRLTVVRNVEEQLNYIYLRSTCFTVAPVRHKTVHSIVRGEIHHLFGPTVKCANTVGNKFTRVLDFIV
jgi:hypothetical protein